MEYRVSAGKRQETINIDEEAGRFHIQMGEREYEVDARRLDPGAVLSLLIDGHCREAEVVPIEHGYEVHLASRSFMVTVQHELLARAGQALTGSQPSGTEVVSSQMPGVVVDVRVAVGDQVAAGDPLVIVEAMKMQNEFGSTTAGTVREIHVKNGDPVTGGQPLVTIDAGGESA